MEFEHHGQHSELVQDRYGTAMWINSVVVYKLGTLIDGRSFRFCRGAPTNNIAQWNGSSWSTLEFRNSGRCASFRE